MSQDLSSAAPWRTAAAMSPIFTLEENCTDTEAGSFGFLPVCKEEASPEQQVKSPSLVQVKLEPPQIKEEQEERNPSLVQVKLEPPQIKEEQEERSPSLVQEKLEPPQIKEEQEEILLSPGEVAGSSVKLQSVKSEDDDENRETECLASTSTEHIKTQAYIKYWVPSQPTSDDQFLSSHYSESDTDDSNDWTRNDETVVNSLESHNTHVEGQRLSLSNKLSQNLKSLKQKPSRKSQTLKKSFCCTECGKVCSRKGDMDKHMRIHTGEKPFACTVCSKSFNQTENLKTHMRIHTGKRPFVCTICSKSFIQTENLKTHMRIHTGEKPFACTICTKSFNQTQHLKTHMRSHTGETPFACTVCDKSFKHNHSLKTHMSIHTGVNPFACIFCNKRFNKSVGLKTHMRIHTGEKPFVCKVCSKSFTQTQHLKTHMKFVHPLIKLPNGSAGHIGSQVDTTNLTSGLARHTVVPIRPKLATNTVQVSDLKIVTLVAPGALLIQSIPRVPQTLRGSVMTIVTPGAIRDPQGSCQGSPGAAGPPDATGPTGGL